MDQASLLLLFDFLLVVVNLWGFLLILFHRVMIKRIDNLFIN